VEVLQFAPAGLALSVPAQKPTVPPTHAMFGADDPYCYGRTVLLTSNTVFNQTTGLDQEQE
jgi:hypothetical protein